MAVRTCDIADCGAIHEAKGLCRKHYRAMPARREADRSYAVTYHKINREDCLARLRARNADTAFKDKRRIYNAERRSILRAQYANDPARRARLQKNADRYRQTNRLKVLEQHRVYNAAHKEQFAFYNAQPHVRAKHNQLTKERGQSYSKHRRSLYDAQSGACGICCLSMVYSTSFVHVDHIVPISIAKAAHWPKERIHDILNLQAVHAACNQRKGVSLPNIETLEERY